MCCKRPQHQALWDGLGAVVVRHSCLPEPKAEGVCKGAGVKACKQRARVGWQMSICSCQRMLVEGRRFHDVDTCKSCRARNLHSCALSFYMLTIGRSPGVCKHANCRLQRMPQQPSRLPHSHSVARHTPRPDWLWPAQPSRWYQRTGFMLSLGLQVLLRADIAALAPALQQAATPQCQPLVWGDWAECCRGLLQRC